MPGCLEAWRLGGWLAGWLTGLLAGRVGFDCNDCKIGGCQMGGIGGMERLCHTLDGQRGRWISALSGDLEFQMRRRSTTIAINTNWAHYCFQGL